YRQAPIWTPGAWGAGFIFTTILGIVLLAKMSDGLLDWLGDRLRRRPLTPLTGGFLVGLTIFGVSPAVSGDFFDRYVLAFVPFVILLMVRGARAWGPLAWRYALGALTVLAVFTLLLQRDFVAHDNARWEAGRWLLARVSLVHVGFDWDNVNGFGN